MPKKQKSGLYRTAVTVAGEKIWLSARTKAELEQKKRETKQHLITGTSTEDITFVQLVARWYEQVYAQIGFRPSTYKSARAIINKWIVGTMNEHQLARAVRRSDLQAVISAMQAECKRMHTSRAVYILSQVCKYGMQLGIMKADYAHNLVIRRQDAPPVRRPSVSPEDVQKMFDNAGDFMPALAVLYYTGMRRGELTALTWADVDFARNVIHVTKTYDMAAKKVGPCKTKNSVRDISMPHQLVEILSQFRGLPAALVSGYRNDITLQTGWIMMLDRAGLATHREGHKTGHTKENYELAYTMHQLRHTYATILYAAGVDPVIASRLMGHSSYKVTADIYTDIEKSLQDKADKAIQHAFAQSLHKDAKNG